MRTACSSALLALALAAGAAAISAAQSANNQKPPKPPVVWLSDASGRPGEVIAVPITFAPGDGAKLRQLRLEVKFRSLNLKFDKVSRSPGDKWKNLELTLEDSVTSGEGREESSRLTILASLPPNVSVPDGIPEGELGKLTFRVEEDADGEMVDLELSAAATAVGSNTPLPQNTVRTEDAMVFILAPGASPGCFFFTH